MEGSTCDQSVREASTSMASWAGESGRAVVSSKRPPLKWAISRKRRVE